MSLYVYIYSKKNVSKELIEKTLANHCHIEYSLSDVIQIDRDIGSFESLFIFSKKTAFYEDHEQVHRSSSNAFNALQGYCWEKYGGESTKPIKSKSLQVLIEKSSSNIRSIQSHLSGEYSTISRLEGGKIISFNDNFGIENIFYYEDDNTFAISNREDFLRIVS